MSFLIFVLSLATGAYGYVSIGGADFKPKIPNVNYTMKWKVDSNMYIAYLCIAGCVFGLTVGVFGFLTSRCKSCWVAFPLGLLSFLAGLLAVIAGVAVFGGNIASTVKNQICGSQTGGTEFIRKQYSPAVDQIMCTATCPCASNTTNVTQSLFTARATAMTNLTRSDAWAWTGTMTSYNDCYKKIKASR
jgi:hypothetical protein